MAYNPIADAIITLESPGVEGDNFNKILFLTPTDSFLTRTLEIGSLSEALEVGGSTYSSIYAAAKSVFLTTPRPNSFKVGRIIPQRNYPVTEGATTATLAFRLDYQGQFDTELQQVEFIITANGIDANDCASQIVDQMNADPIISDYLDVGYIEYAGLDTPEISVRVAKESVYTYLAAQTVAIDGQFFTFESPEDALLAIEDSDPGFYFIVGNFPPLTRDADIQAVASYVESATTARMFFQRFASPTDPLISTLDQNNYVRTKGFCYQDNGGFPELSFVAYNSVYLPGSVSWTNLNIALQPSKDASGNNLSRTSKGNLEDQNVAYVDFIGGRSVIRNGFTFGEQPIDTIHGRDNLISDLKVSLSNLHINQQGGKIQGNDQGIAQLMNTTKGVLESYVIRNFIEPNYRLNFANASQWPLADRQNRIYRSGSFEAQLTGAIEGSVVSGTLSVQLN